MVNPTVVNPLLSGFVIAPLELVLSQAQGAGMILLKHVWGQGVKG